MSIVLTTINAKFQHAAFGLRYLFANLGPLQDQCVVKEWSLGVRARDVVEQILVLQPKILGLSVYIWNVDILTEVAQLVKALRPDIRLVIGGPEVSHEWEEMPLFQTADFLIRGEGDLAFAALCSQLLRGESPEQKALPGGLPPLKDLASPYPHYNDFDLQHKRIVYVEASRGCPFQCHFCLSSLDKSVRTFELDEFLGEMERLLARGVRQFKFVDRTFNLKTATSLKILSFFAERYEPGMFCHFEMIPDRLPESLRPVIRGFPEGVLQFEVGIQSFDPEVCARIGRRQNFEALEDNLRFLAEETGVHVHADLIAGLPGEDLASFGRGFDRLWSLGVTEIQVGILKRLRGTPITTADPEWGMVYAKKAPYEVLQTAHLSFSELQRLNRFARYWDLVANSGRFPRLLRSLLGQESAFERFLRFSDWLYEELGATAGISAKRLGESLAEFTVEVLGFDAAQIDSELKADRSKKSDANLPKRQARHLNAG